MVLSLSVVSAVHFARVSRTPMRNASMLSNFLKGRAASYGTVGASSLFLLSGEQSKK